jgi:hypothetical protein
LIGRSTFDVRLIHELLVHAISPGEALITPATACALPVIGTVFIFHFATFEPAHQVEDLVLFKTCLDSLVARRATPVSTASKYNQAIRLRIKAGQKVLAKIGIFNLRITLLSHLIGPESQGNIVGSLRMAYELIFRPGSAIYQEGVLWIFHNHLVCLDRSEITAHVRLARLVFISGEHQSSKNAHKGQ